MEKNISVKGKVPLIGAIGILLLLCAGAGIVLGSYEISLADVYSIIYLNVKSIITGSSPPEGLKNTIVWNLRLPRIILAVFVGAALAIAGAVFQGCFKNPLVEPYILGVSSGSAFGAALGILYPAVFLSVSFSSFVFGSMAVAITYLFSKTRGQSTSLHLILGGIIVGSIFSALVSLLKYISNDTALREIVFWMMGGFYYASWSDVVIVVPIVVFSALVVWYYAWKLNVLSLGDDEARSLGVSPKKLRFILLSLATLITAVSVSTVGIIAWVGLMMPHASRLIIGPDNRYVIPTAAFLGGMYLIVCDTLARTLTTSEIPVGIITSLLGAPYLLYLLKSKGSKVI